MNIRVTFKDAVEKTTLYTDVKEYNEGSNALTIHQSDCDTMIRWENILTYSAFNDELNDDWYVETWCNDEKHRSYFLSTNRDELVRLKKHIESYIKDSVVKVFRIGDLYEYLNAEEKAISMCDWKFGWNKDDLESLEILGTQLDPSDVVIYSLHINKPHMVM